MKKIISLSLVLSMCALISCVGGASQKQANSQTQDTQEQKDEMINEELAAACFDGDVSTAMYLINSGVNVNVSDEGGFTYLMYAAYNGHIEIIHLLLSKGAKVNTVNNDGRTALMLGATAPSVPTIKALLEAGAEVNIVDNDEKFTALMFAATEGLIDNVKLLLEWKADTNLKDKDGDTAMSFAAAKRHYDVVALLKPITK